MSSAVVTFTYNDTPHRLVVRRREDANLFPADLAVEFATKATLGEEVWVPGVAVRELGKMVAGPYAVAHGVIRDALALALLEVATVVIDVGDLGGLP